MIFCDYHLTAAHNQIICGNCKHVYPSINRITGLPRRRLDKDHPETWPRRPCPKSPDDTAAAAALGVTVEEYRQLTNPALGTPEEQGSLTYEEYRDKRIRENVEKAKEGAERLGIGWKDGLHYVGALVRWGKAGFPVREQEEVERIEKEICRPCEQYIEGRCKKCGCNVSTGIAIVNKIRMTTETCPLGKWPGDKPSPTEAEKMQAAILMAQVIGQEPSMDAVNKQVAIGQAVDVLGVAVPGDKPEEKP